MASTMLKANTSEMENKLEKLLDHAIFELRKKVNHYNTETAHNERVIKEFGLSDYYASIPDDICSLNDSTDFNLAMTVQNQKLEKLKNETTVAQLETYLNSLKTMKKSMEEYSAYLQREIEKYENEYLKECHNCNQDGFDFTNLQTSIHKLQSEIYQANEQQEPKSNVTAKLSQCFDIHNEISELQKELDRIKNELATVGHLPPNLTDAERKLKDLKKKYREISNEFSKKVSK